MLDIFKIAYAFFAGHPGTLTFVVCLSYFALLIYTRRRMVFAPDEQEFVSEATKLIADIEAYPEPMRNLPDVKSARMLILVTIDRFEQWKPGPLERWFATGAHVRGCWEDLHEAKRLMIAALPLEDLNVRLRAAAVELRRVKTDWAEEATALAGDIERFHGLDKTRNGQKHANGEVRATPASDRARALLRRALRVLYSVEGSEDQSAANWHNKSLWISTTSLLFIVVLAVGFGHPGFLLMGALGGFLSKLARLRSSKEVPADYGSYWATFFFSGPLGALIGWSGLMLVYALSQAKLLGEAFDKITWTSGATPGIADAAAFLLGFSATLFEQLITRSEEQARPRASAKRPTPTVERSPELRRKGESGKGGRKTTVRRHAPRHAGRAG